MRTDYEQLARRYDEDRDQWSFVRDDIVEERLGPATPSMSLRVLDIGCGTGRWLAAQQAFFSDAPLTWIGLDPSTAMLGEASAKGIMNLVRAGAEAIPLPDATIDYVSSSYAFHHFADKERALDEVRRVLVEHGAFRINNIDPTAAGGWWLYEFFPETIAIDAARFWPATRIADALEARQFTVELTLDTGPQQLPASEALADAERRVVSQLALLDDASYARGLDRLRAVAAAPNATVTTTRSNLRLTAIRRADR